MTGGGVKGLNRILCFLLARCAICIDHEKSSLSNCILVYRYRAIFAVLNKDNNLLPVCFPRQKKMSTLEENDFYGLIYIIKGGN